MEKRVLVKLLCFIAVMMFCIFPITVKAEEVGAESSKVAEADISASDEAVVETPASQAPEYSDGEKSTYHTLFTRVWEFVTTYSGETLSVIGSVILLILNLILKHSSSKMSKETREELEKIKGGVKETLGGQDSVVDVTNRMIDGYNGLSERYDAMKETYDRYGAMEGERNRIVGAVLATNSAVLEILTTVYANSRNLPQGVKDLVNLKYANCLKSLEDDERLMAIVEAVRNNIGSATSDTETETNTDNAEV